MSQKTNWPIQVGTLAEAPEKSISPDPSERVYAPTEPTSTPQEVDAQYSPQNQTTLNLSSPIQRSDTSADSTELAAASVPLEAQPGPISNAIQSSLGLTTGTGAPSLEYPPPDYSNYYSAFYQAHADPNHANYFSNPFTVSSLIQKPTPPPLPYTKRTALEGALENR